MKVRLLSVCLCLFSWSEAQYDNFTPLLPLMGIEWLLTYHLSPYKQQMLSTECRNYLVSDNLFP